MDGGRLGRLSLRLDAVYCGVAAAVVGLAADAWSGPSGAPAGLLRAIATLVAVWAGLLWLLARRGRVGRSLRFVGVANVVAAAAIAVAAALVPSIAMAVLLGAVAVEVAAFAISQAVAVRRSGAAA